MVVFAVSVTTVTSQKKRFALQGPIQAPWRVAPCELYTLLGYRFASGANGMEYKLEPSIGSSVEMVRWKQRGRSRQVELMEEDGSLYELGSLVDASTVELVNWVSRRGLLGFRPSNELISAPGLVHSITLGSERVHGPENELGYAYEPLLLIQEAARVAQAATALYEAIRKDDVLKRAGAIREILQMNPDTGVRYSGVTEIEMSVFSISIGLHEYPKIPAKWTMLAIEALAELTDRYLSSEFTLYWSEPKAMVRTVTTGWKVRSHFGAMFLKMASRLRRARHCKICKEPLNSRARSDAQICSSKCRKRWERHPERYA